MNELRETSDIKTVIRAFKTHNFSTIVIDGMDGVGKTTLAKRLQRGLKCDRLSLDNFLKTRSGGYVNFIQYTRLKERIALAAKPIIIEGVCPLAVLKNLKKKTDFIIYVKLCSKDGCWRDEDKCDVKEDIDDFISRQKELLVRFADAEAGIEGRTFDGSKILYPQLREELIRYHHKCRPHKKADIIFKRMDG